MPNLRLPASGSLGLAWENNFHIPYSRDSDLQVFVRSVRTGLGMPSADSVSTKKIADGPGRRIGAIRCARPCGTARERARRSHMKFPTGHADPQGYEGEFRDKPGVMSIAPGTSRSFRMAATVRT